MEPWSTVTPPAAPSSFPSAFEIGFLFTWVLGWGIGFSLIDAGLINAGVDSLEAGQLRTATTFLLRSLQQPAVQLRAKTARFRPSFLAW